MHRSRLPSCLYAHTVHGMKIEFIHNGQTLTADHNNRIIPIQDKDSRIHLATWGSYGESGFLPGIWHSLSFWRSYDPTPTWVPIPLKRYAVRGTINGFKTFECPEPLCGALCRHDGKSRVYIVHSDIPGDTVIVPLSYRGVISGDAT